MHYILIILILSSGNAGISVEFNNKEACENAKIKFNSHGVYTDIRSECVEKGN